MTNTEKYLKDGTDLQELCCNYAKFCNDRKIRLTEEDEPEPLNDGGKLGIFLQQNIKPALTEDERVILNHINIYEFDKIGRANNGDLYLHYRDDKDTEDFWWCNHLLQFIKERRRI